MDEFIRPRSYGHTGSMVETPAEKLAFLRKVYALLTGSVVTAAAGAMVALYAGADLSQATMHIGRQVLTVPPLVAWFSNHWIIGAILFIGSFFGASKVRERPGINVAAFFGASFLSGLYIAPMLWFSKSPDTATGLRRCVVVPSPSWPELFDPHANTVPSVFSTTVY